ncbi:hypothetical protein [Mycobacterium pinniadriaticum]|uniref:Uncharacterized protein n=1 Tax=Mycobacterium pinniadriaticum TaxID=2994102 RepID=A0ABT3SE81_9MYCO|nr:hypothetical protein [Mycobacterium pinniadriaticum]MCX2937805.1 hypothetical protein [Mycobacterium pinniadriaticum]
MDLLLGGSDSALGFFDVDLVFGHRDCPDHLLDDALERGLDGAPIEPFVNVVEDLLQITGGHRTPRVSFQ